MSLHLFGKMAESFGEQLCEIFAGLEILSLGDDSQLKVRKEAVHNITKIGKVVSKDFFNEKLLEFYLSKSTDNQPIIRKSCAEIIVDVSKLCEYNTRIKVLTNSMLSFLNDTNKWVKIAAYKNLVPFIDTLQLNDINQQLFDHFNKMTSTTQDNFSNDSEIVLACAYNFPAVIKIFGKDKWEQLKDTFKFLTEHENIKVK